MDPYVGYKGFDPSTWGGQGTQTDANGNPIAGSSGLDQDVARYGSMQRDVNPNGAAIDRTQSNQARGMSMGALGLLGQTAAGTVPSAAEQLGMKQTQDAQNAQYSMGASVRGGAMARAAAARGATMGAATIGQVGAQNQAATRAGEMANARDAYFGAVTGQRGEDVGLATDQAKLQAAQNAQNENHDAYYAQLGYNTKKAAADSALGRSAADEAASNASAIAGLNERAQGQAQEKDVLSASVGAANGAHQGAMAGYSGSQPVPAPASPGPTNSGALAPDPYGNPYDDGNGGNNPDTTSDIQAKTNVQPMNADARSYASRLPGPQFFGAQHPGDPTLPGPQRSLPGPQLPGPQQPAVFGARQMLSDPRAKQEAYDLGVARGLSAGPATRNAPAEISGVRANHNAPTEGRAATGNFERKDSGPQRAAVDARSRSVEDAHDAMLRGATLMPVSPALGAGYLGGGSMAQYEAQHRGPMPAPPPMQSPPPAAPPEAPPSEGIAQSVGQFAGRMRAMVSDARTKERAHGANAMADANRSMAASSYEYKPQYAARAGQHVGEKNVGPMANNMAADPVAGTAIVRDPSTGLLAIDKEKGLKLTMGGLASLQRQVDQMKGQHR